MTDYLTEEEKQALSEPAPDATGDTQPGDADQVGGGSDKPVEPQAAEPREEEQQAEAPGPQDIEILSKDGKHFIPYDVLKSIRDENQQLKRQLEELRELASGRLEQPAQQQPVDDRIVRGEDGDEYVPLEKATLEELLAARVEKLAEGDYATVNAIDLRIIDIKQKEAIAYAEFARAQAEFAARNPWYQNDPILTKIADSIILELDADPAWRGKSFREGWLEVEKRLSRYVQPQPAQPAKPTEPVQQKTRQNPVSLSGVPNAGSSETKDRWAQLDALAQSNPLAFERAIMELSPEAYREYVNRR